MRNVRIILHSAHFKSNVDFIKTYYPHTPHLCMAIKSNAYGHGITEIVHLALENNISSFCVANTEEAVQLRECGIIGNIYLFSIPDQKDISTLVEHSIVLMISDKNYLHQIYSHAEQQQKIHPVHIQVDTGMGRLGCQPQKVLSLHSYIQKNPYLRYSGIATHLSSADMDPEFTQTQLQAFHHILSLLKQNQANLQCVHAANSAAFFRFPQSVFDMVRIGIAIYGYPPYSDDIFSILKPVMELQSYIVYIKRVPAHTPISYQHTYQTTQISNIATIAIGYGHGLSRSLSNRGTVLIQGKQYPIIGNICMDHLMVNLGRDFFKPFTPVSIFGPDKQGISAQDIAKKIGTIPYEVLCAPSPLIARKII